MMTSRKHLNSVCISVYIGKCMCVCVCVCVFTHICEYLYNVNLRFQLGSDVIKIFSSVINKLECLSLASISTLEPT